MLTVRGHGGGTIQQSPKSPYLLHRAPVCLRAPACLCGVKGGVGEFADPARYGGTPDTATGVSMFVYDRWVWWGFLGGGYVKIEGIHIFV